MEEKVFNAARVYILDAPYSIDRPFDYFVPEELRKELAVGIFVSVPFGRGNRRMTAAVFDLFFREDISELKAVDRILESGGLQLNREMRALCLFMKEQTFCTVGDAVRAAMPTGALRGMCAFYRTAGPLDAKLNEAAKLVYAAISDASCEGPDAGLTGRQIVDRFGSEARELLSALISLKAIERRYRSENRAGRIYEKIYTIGKSEHSLPAGKKQRAIYDAISLSEGMSAGDLSKIYGNCSAALKTMVERGQLSFREEEVYRRAFTLKTEAPDENILTEEQLKAKETICALCDMEQPKAALLYGVTGSGKTRVMKAVIDHVLSAGKSVIVLVPEISLTPQTVRLFSSFFGDDVAILHSGLSVGQKYDEWRRIKEGRARICIGTRSAIFAPFENLGLIIIDEEQEHTYKSDMSPRYHARDIARFRCREQRAVMLLASATPSVESFYKAKQGIYTLCTLEKRYESMPLPKAVICDMRGSAGLASPIGEVLTEELSKNLERGEQSILFVGRRGYNNFATCLLCGETPTCPHCSVSLTYHAFGRYDPKENSAEERGRNGQMVCHYCGYRCPVPKECPSCGSSLLQFVGCGTQMVESELEKCFPGMPILRLDADTTGSKDAFEEKLESFRRGREKIMLGTQMVTKGHDFPNVTLVGVISADDGLYMDDYRAGEHTFSLITQVIGRAGRAEKPGRAVIQTFNPENKTLKLAAKQDYAAFYENEIRLRRSLVFPPFCDIVVLNVSAQEEGELRQAVLMLDRELKKLMKEREGAFPLTLFGPFEAPLYRVKDRYRMRFVMKTKNCRALRETIGQLMVWFGTSFRQKVQLSADVNPSSL